MVDRAYDFFLLQRGYGIIKWDEPFNLEGRRRRPGMMMMIRRGTHVSLSWIFVQGEKNISSFCFLRAISFHLSPFLTLICVVQFPVYALEFSDHNIYKKLPTLNLVILICKIFIVSAPIPFPPFYSCPIK